MNVSLKTPDSYGNSHLYAAIGETVWKVIFETGCLRLLEPRNVSAETITNTEDISKEMLLRGAVSRNGYVEYPARTYKAKNLEENIPQLAATFDFPKIQTGPGLWCSYGLIGVKGIGKSKSFYFLRLDGGSYELTYHTSASADRYQADKVWMMPRGGFGYPLHRALISLVRWAPLITRIHKMPRRKPSYHGLISSWLQVKFMANGTPRISHKFSDQYY